MRPLFASTLVAATLSLVAAAGAQQTQNSQQQLMKSCNSQAQSQNLSGDARKSFMSNCLSGKESGSSGTSSSTSQQQLMKSCNTTASSQQLTGDARKQFMSNCLKGH